MGIKSSLFSLLAFFLAGSFLVSCNPQDPFDDTMPDQNEGTKVLACIEDYRSEFIYLTNAGNNNLLSNQIVNWNQNDSIALYAGQRLITAFLSNSISNKEAVFTVNGTILVDSLSYSVFYPYNEQSLTDDGLLRLSLDNQTQCGNSNFSHIYCHNYMATPNASIENDTLIVYLTPLTSIIHFIITMPQKGKYTRLLLETDNNIIKNSFYNFSDSTIVNKAYSPIQVLDLCDIQLNENNLVLDAYVAISPIDLTNNSLCVKVYDEDGNIYTINGEIGHRSFDSGKIYHVIGEAGISSESTGLPTIIINTPDNQDITSKEHWLEGYSSIAIINSDGSINYEATDLAIKGRGNSSWKDYPKKPYALKLGSKAELLGMKKHKRWCLLANWMDRTLLRNEVAFYIAKQTGLDWTPSGEYVELILNGTHLGNYYLCEQIKVDKNRLNITEMKETDIDGDALTGGYLIEMDKNFDEKNKFLSEINHFPCMIKSPDDDIMQPSQLSYIQNYINSFETFLYSENWLESREYANYVDIDSFVDWWFVYELAMNGEPYHPKSCYFYKNRLGKLKAGPVWDFDFATFLPSSSEIFIVKSSLYYERLFCDPFFVNAVKNRWKTYKQKFDTVPSHIRKVATQIKKSCESNYKMWPLTGYPASVSGDADISFDEAVDRLVSAYIAKFNWLNDQIENM